MLVNRPCSDKIEFLEYSGKYPTLCCGILILNIEGEDVYFGQDIDFQLALDKGKIAQIPKHYEPFWSSGGACFKYNCTYGQWDIDYKKIPDKWKKYAFDIDFLFNEHVQYGCCGGCK